jgi:hypothetical protein
MVSNDLRPTNKSLLHDELERLQYPLVRITQQCLNIFFRVGFRYDGNQTQEPEVYFGQGNRVGRSEPVSSGAIRNHNSQGSWAQGRIVGSFKKKEGFRLDWGTKFGALMFLKTMNFIWKINYFFWETKFASTTNRTPENNAYHFLGWARTSVKLHDRTQQHCPREHSLPLISSVLSVPSTLSRLISQPSDDTGRFPHSVPALPSTSPLGLLMERFLPVTINQIECPISLSGKTLITAISTIVWQTGEMLSFLYW